MLSLFELMSNPGNLALYHDLMGDFPLLTLFLVAFVIFGSFGMIALLTGVISESMFDKNQTRVQELRAEREQKRQILKQKCHELYDLVDKDEFNEAHKKDLEDMLPYVRDMFNKLDIEYMEHEFEGIIQIFDTDDSGSISEAEFVTGILSLCDGVRAESIREVYYLVSQMNAKVVKMEGLNREVSLITRKAIPEMQVDIQRIMQKLNITPQPQLVSSGISANVTQLTTNVAESHLREMKASMASAMDDHTSMLKKKIDDMHSHLKELCKRQDIVNGNVFTVPEGENASSRQWAGYECPPVLPDLWPGTENNGKGTTGHTSNFDKHSYDPGIAPLSPPPSAGTAGNTMLRTLSPDPPNDIQSLLK